MPNEGITNCQSEEMATALIQVYQNQLQYNSVYKPKMRCQNRILNQIAITTKSISVVAQRLLITD